MSSESFIKSLAVSAIAGAVFLWATPLRAEKNVRDMEDALEYCRIAPLERPEGVWEFPEDETRVLIKKTPGKPRSYDIVHISGPDCRLQPGETIGRMTATVDRNKYKLSLSVSRDYGLLSDTRSCSAEFREKENSLVIRPARIKITTRTLWFLPKFWRSLKIIYDNPAADLPHGIIRIYPPALPENPVYL